MVAFNAADHARVAAGEITVTWRLWKYAHVKAGGVYATGHGGALAIDDVRRVRAAEVTNADAREAGLPDAQALIDLARGHKGVTVSDETILYRVQFHYLPYAPERPRLSLAEVSLRLERLDGASRLGPWTEAALRLIEENPGVVARLLAADLGLPTPLFKRSVRKLKALGLTISLDVGYELSELGQTYLDSLAD
jgi:hypothetical protein